MLVTFLYTMVKVYSFVLFAMFVSLHTNAQSLTDMLKEDQAVRAKLRELPREQVKAYIDEIMLPGDKIRLEKTEKILNAGHQLSAEELLAAAFIMQHGSQTKHFKLAMELALQSLELDPTNEDAMWLSCASEDRYRLKVDRPQVWGTQLKRKMNSENTHQIYYLENFDRTVKTDEQRLKRGLTTLNEIESRLSRMAKESERAKQYSIWKTGK